ISCGSNRVNSSFCGLQTIAMRIMRSQCIGTVAVDSEQWVGGVSVLAPSALAIAHPACRCSLRSSLLTPPTPPTPLTPLCKDQKLLVPFCSGDRRRDRRLRLPIECAQAGGNFINGQTVSCGIAHDASFAYVLPARLELRLDQY